MPGHRVIKYAADINSQLKVLHVRSNQMAGDTGGGGQVYLSESQRPGNEILLMQERVLKIEYSKTSPKSHRSIRSEQKCDFRGDVTL